jgi:hypothetical protein
MKATDIRPAAAPQKDTGPARHEGSRTRRWLGIVVTLIGLFVLTLGAKPEWLGLDRSPGIGFLQITVFSLALGIICLGGLIALLSLWKGIERTLMPQIGIRLVATGYIISFFSAMADLLGFGSQPKPQGPYFGPIQAVGFVIGEAVIAIGFLMLLPYRAGSKER